ncbi:MAG TPA: O-antigen ligase family protein [Acidimicrobiales bacterium]|nr:O-antigen ligase family protein [Acidimicrobiales bacterium]
MKIAWIALLALALLGLLAGTSGFLTPKIFHQVSTLKWAIIAGGPLLLILLLTVRRPSLWATGLVILTIPIEPYVMTIHGQPVSILFVTALQATVVVTIEGGLRHTQRRSTLGAVSPWIALLLIIPTILGASVIHELLCVLMFVDVAWICTRVAFLYADGREVIVLVFIGLAGVQSLLALSEYISGHSINLYGGAGTPTYSTQDYFFTFGTNIRTTGTFFDPISLGNVLAMALPLALLVLLRRDSRTAYRWFAGAMALLVIGGLTVSLSRASWIGACAGVLCVAFFSRGVLRRRAFGLAATLLLGSLIIGSTLYGPALAARFDSIFHPTASTVRTAPGDKLREQDWNVSFGVFEQNPITGVGFGRLVAHLEAEIPGTDSSSQAQNTYLQYLAEGGVIGGAALLLLGAAVSNDLYRSRRTDWLYPGLVGSFVSVAIAWVTDYTVQYYAVAGCLAVAVGLAASSSYRSATKEIAPSRQPLHAISQ